jgi:hypothetical protein
MRTFSKAKDWVVTIETIHYEHVSAGSEASARRRAEQLVKSGAGRRVRITEVELVE